MQLSRSVFIFATSLAAKAQATNDFDPGRKTVLAVDWNARFEPSEADAVGVTAAVHLTQGMRRGQVRSGAGQPNTKLVLSYIDAEFCN